MRVVIVWPSHPDNGHPPATDPLQSDLELRVYQPDGGWAGSSTNIVENWNIVEFTANSSGRARIDITKYRFDGTSEYLAIAWARDATRLPDIVSDYNNGWDSRIAIHNGGSTSRDVIIQMFSPNGDWAGQASWSVPSGQVWLYDPPQQGFYGSGVVNGSEDLSVVVINDKGSQAYAYSGIPTNPPVSGIGAGRYVYIPANLSNYYGWNSDLYVQNAGSAKTTIHAYLYNDSGSQRDHWSQQDVNPGAMVTIVLSGTTTGSVIVHGQQVTDTLAAIVRHKREDVMAYEGFSGGGSAGYLPTLFKNYYGWNSSYQTQEVVGASTSVGVTYYPSGGKSFSLNAWGHREVYMGGETLPGPRVSAKESVDANRRVTTAVQHASATAALGYHGSKAGVRDLFMPFLRKNVAGWDASLTVQNVGTVKATITVRFYTLAGGLVGTPYAFDLDPGYSSELYSQLPSGLEGSAWVHSEGADVIAAVHETQTGGRAWGYSMP